MVGGDDDINHDDVDITDVYHDDSGANVNDDGGDE